MKTINEGLEVASLQAVPSVHLEVLRKRGRHHGAHVESLPAAVCRVPPRGKHHLAEKKVHVTFKVNHDSFGEYLAESLLQTRSCAEWFAAY